jgi:hypothetical protein
MRVVLGGGSSDAQVAADLSDCPAAQQKAQYSRVI